MEIAAEKFEALGADVPTIPQPTEIVPQGYAERWRVAVQTITDVEVVEEAQRRLLALERYVKDKGRQDEVRAACRWCELRIGELLGPPERGGDRRSEDFKSSAVDLNANERVWFRSMAENREVVQQCIEDGKTSRSAILSEIKTVNGIVNGKEWTLEAALRRIEAAIKAETREASGADYVAMGEWLAKLGEQMKSTRTMDLVAGRCETTGDNILTVVADNIKASEPNGCDLLKDRELAGR